MAPKSPSTVSSAASGGIGKTDTNNSIALLNGANTFTGPTQWNTVGGQGAVGFIQLGNALALQNSTVIENYNRNGGQTFSGSIGTFTLGGLSGSDGQGLTDLSSIPITLQVGNNGANTTYTGALSGGGVLGKIGSGMLTLGGNSGYSGGTIVTAGTLQLGNNGGLGATTGGLTVNSVLDLNGYNPTVGAVTGNTGAILVNSATTSTLTMNPTSGAATYNGTLGGGLGMLSIAKTGAGTEVLTGANTYTGTTNVNGGALIVTGMHSGGGAYTVGNGATLAGTGLISGTNTVTLNSGATVSPGASAGAGSVGTFTLPNLSFNNGSTALLDLAGTATSNGGVSDLISVTGNLSLSGTDTINVNPVNLALSNGTYGLINFGGTLSGGTSNLQLAGAASGGQVRQSFQLVLSGTSNAAINLVVSGSAANLIWSGTNGSAWDVVTTKNWNNAGTSDYFYNSDLVTFDDTGSNSVTVASNVSPGSVTFNNNASTYTLSGAGKIIGNGPLMLTGTGTVILANSNGNDYTGATTFNSGVLVLGSSNALHNSLVSVNANNSFGFLPGVGTFYLGGLSGSGALSLSDTTGAAIALSVGGAASTTYSGVISGPGALSQNGSGTFTLAGANTFSGGAAVTSGVLQLANSAAAQNSVLTVAPSGSLVFVSGIGTFKLGGLSGYGSF